MSVHPDQPFDFKILLVFIPTIVLTIAISYANEHYLKLRFDSGLLFGLSIQLVALLDFLICRRIDLSYALRVKVPLFLFLLGGVFMAAASGFQLILDLTCGPSMSCSYSDYVRSDLGLYYVVYLSFVNLHFHILINFLRHRGTAIKFRYY